MTDAANDSNSSSNNPSELSEDEYQKIRKETAKEMARMLDEGEYDVEFSEGSIHIELDTESVPLKHHDDIQTDDKKNLAKLKTMNVVETLQWISTTLIIMIALAYVVLNSLAISVSSPVLTSVMSRGLLPILTLLTILWAASMLYNDMVSRS